MSGLRAKLPIETINKSQKSTISRTSQLTADLSSIWSNGDGKILQDASRKSSQSSSINSSKLRRKTLAYGEKVHREILRDLSSEDDEDGFVKLDGTPHLLPVDDDFLETCTPLTAKALTLPPTQISGPLKGIAESVFAYLEVFSGHENRSEYFADELRLLGASVCQRFLLTKVTHVVFREGRQSTLLKAWAKKIPVVSILWIDSCTKTNEMVPVDKFLVSRNDVNLFGKRLKCMQPKKFVAEVALSDDNMQKRVKRIESRKLMKEITNLKITPSPVKDRSGESQETILVQETPRINGEYVSSFASRLLSSRAKWLSMTETCTPESLRKQMQEIKDKLAGLTENSSPDSESQCESLSQIRSLRLRKHCAKKVLRNGHATERYMHRNDRGGMPVPKSPRPYKRHELLKRTLNFSARNFSNTVIPSTPSASMTPSSLSRESLKENSACRSTNKSPRRLIMDTSNLTPVNSVRHPSFKSDFDLRRRRRTLAVEFDARKSVERSPPKKTQVLPILTENDRESVEVQSLYSGVCPDDSGGERISLVIDASDEKTNEEFSNQSNINQQRIKYPECNYTASSSSVSVSTLAVKVVDTSRVVKTNEIAINTRLRDRLEDDSIPASLKMRETVSQVFHNVMKNSLQQNVRKSLVSPKKRRLFDERRSVVDLTASPSTNQKENIPRVGESAVDDISTVFENLKKKSPPTKQKFGRLRSSMFNMKTRSSAIQLLQTGRPSNEEFKSLDRYSPSKARCNAETTTTIKKTPLKSTVRGRRKTLAPGLHLLHVSSYANATVEQSKVINKVVKRLGGFILQQNVDHSTTHVVCGAVRRTLNVLYGVVRDCKIVSFEWIVESQKKKRWLDIDSFLVSEFATPSDQSCKKLLSKMGPIFLAKNTQPPAEHMKALLAYCGAKVTTSAKRCLLCIGQHSNCPVRSTVVNEKWLLDSIVKRKALPFDPYVIG
uniref:BRCT domain-containing protein n=1 Tax=Romanomermis culicivorax TaxID=13658 RepID=A0A915L7K8_ROMCU